MDKEESTKILAKELGDRVGREVVMERVHKDTLFKNASDVYQLDTPFIVNAVNYNEGYKFYIGEKGKKTLDEILLFANKEANYYFLERLSSSDYLNFAATPYALIGEKEKKDLKKLFYKDVSKEIKFAMRSLDIKNFVELYNNYIKQPPLPLSLLNVIGKFYNFVHKAKYDSDNEVNKKIFQKQIGKNAKQLNDLFNGVGLKARIGRKRNGEVNQNADFISKATIVEIRDQLQEKFPFIYFFSEVPIDLNDSLIIEFLDFVFSLPYEEQNIEANKNILAKYTKKLECIEILTKEYCQGKYFKEYFECLDKEGRESIVNFLKTIPERNPIFDSFLWSKGFKDIDLDYLKFYKKDAKEFIKYFKSKNVEDKKVILNDIYKCKFTNEEVTDWLDAKEPQLVKEVGLQNG